MPLSLGEQVQITLQTEHPIKPQQIESTTIEFQRLYRDIDQYQTIWRPVVIWKQAQLVESADARAQPQDQFILQVPLPEKHYASDWYGKDRRFAWVLIVNIQIDETLETFEFELPVVGRQFSEQGEHVPLLAHCDKLS